MSEEQLNKERNRFMIDLNKIAPNKQKFINKLTRDYDLVTQLQKLRVELLGRADQTEFKKILQGTLS